ncbi:MAG TPA: hypothetical protein DHW17_05180 [Nitrospina sp.]|jgi:hypothetical protein|nr:hypothetical protein [Nitrospina sp.]|tara:strand:+ start:35 stop:658 length:624 start_codon:yes stop_codon:yes gene_type:complete
MRQVKVLVYFFKSKVWLILALSVFIGCTYESKEDIANLPATDINKLDVSQFEGSRSKSVQQVEAPDSYGSPVTENHPNVQEKVKIERGVVVPDGVKGKWKAVKLLVKNKKDEERNEMKTITLGSSFELEDSGIRVTVGPFLPNFVMSQKAYTSSGNELTNPAVQLVVEQNGKTLYTGWAFAKYPTMYAFEHDVFALQLMDYIPIDVS